MTNEAGAAADVAVRLGHLESQFLADAAAVDAAETVPAEHMTALAASGLYGISAPVPEGGLGLGYAEVCAVVENLASACLASTFVWVQHLRFLGAMLDPATPASLRDELRGAAIRGDIKAGVALTGLMPGPPRLTAQRGRRGWFLEGEAPWVSGWGIVDLVVVVARGPDDTVVTMLLDAKAQPGLSVRPGRLSAANASRTVRLGFEHVAVGRDRVISEQSYELARGQSERLRLNGSFALGVAKRCCAVIGPSPLDQELMDRRGELGSAREEDMPSARAQACELAVRAAHALAVGRGSRSALSGDIAERLGREAAFLLVFASRPAIKDALLQRLYALPGKWSPGA